MSDSMGPEDADTFEAEHPFNIDGKLYLESMYRWLQSELTDEQQSSLERLDLAIWDKIEEDMAGYMHLLTETLRARIWHERQQTTSEIEKLTQ